MGRRQRLVSTSILRAIFKTGPKDPDKRPSLLVRILAFFAIYQLALTRYRAKLFKKLRNQIWQIEEEEYTESFRSPSHGKRTDLIAAGDLGYSGSVGLSRSSPLAQMANKLVDVLHDSELKIPSQVFAPRV